MTYIIAEAQDLKSVITKLYVTVRRYQSKKVRTVCEVTLITGKATFTAPGAIFSIAGETIGTAKASFNLKLFYDVLKSMEDKEIKIEIEKEFISLNSVSIPAKAFFPEDDIILKTIILPINYNEADLLRLKIENYNDEELRFNNTIS